jgi:RimJ/RimL family protein N-acetyltransferase
MYNFSICRDKDLIVKTLTSPNNAPYQFEEDEDLSQLNPVLDGRLNYIKCCFGNLFLGIVILIDYGTIAEGHFCFLPVAYGSVVAICRECLSWIWKMTKYNKITAPVLETNTLARRVVEKIGFKCSGSKKHKKQQMIVYIIDNRERA